MRKKSKGLRKQFPNFYLSTVQYLIAYSPTGTLKTAVENQCNFPNFRLPLKI